MVGASAGKGTHTLHTDRVGDDAKVILHLVPGAALARSLSDTLTRALYLFPLALQMFPSIAFNLGAPFTWQLEH